MTLKGWTVAVGVVLLLPRAPEAATEANFGAKTTGDLVELCTGDARQRDRNGGSQFLRRLCAGCGIGGNAEHGCIPRTEAVLLAEPAALPQRSAERVRQLGTRVAGTHGSHVDRRVVPVPERTLPLSAIALINRSGNAMNKLSLLAAVALPLVACADMTPTQRSRWADLAT